MAKLILGGNEFPLVMTVGVLDDMAMRGYPVDKIPSFSARRGSPSRRTWSTASSLF